MVCPFFASRPAKIGNDPSPPTGIPASPGLAMSRCGRYEDDATLKRMTNEAFGRIMGAEDTKEGLTAFIEKRAPNWQGR